MAHVPVYKGPADAVEHRQKQIKKKYRQRIIGKQNAATKAPLNHGYEDQYNYAGGRQDLPPARADCQSALRK